MSGAGPYAFAHPALDIFCQLLIVQESYMLFPRQAYPDAQVMPQGYIKKPSGRYRIGPDRIYAACGHLREIAVNCLRIVVLAAIFIGPERAVGYTSDVEFFIADADELPFYGNPQTFPDRDLPGRIEVELCDPGRFGFFEMRPKDGLFLRKREQLSGILRFLCVYAFPFRA